MQGMLGTEEVSSVGKKRQEGRGRRLGSSAFINRDAKWSMGSWKPPLES